MLLYNDTFSEIEDAEYIESVYANAFCSAVKEFFNSRFRGCVKINCDIENRGAIIPSYLMPTLLLKELLSLCQKDIFIFISIYDVGEKIMFDIKPHGIDNMDAVCTPMLIKLARSGGMNIIQNDNNIQLTLATAYSDRRNIYAPIAIDDVSKIISLINGIFFKKKYQPL